MTAPMVDVAALRARRVWINVEVRRASLLKSAVPSLGQTKPLKQWRRLHQLQHDSSLRRFRRELKGIASLIGPPPEFFKPRPSKACDARIRRQYSSDYRFEQSWRRRQTATRPVVEDQHDAHVYDRMASVA